MRISHLFSLISSVIVTIPVLVITTLGSDLVAGVSADHGNDVQLTAFLLSGEKLRRSPSCVHSYASVKMVNTHKKETITILSMETIQKIDNNKVFSRIPQIYASQFKNMMEIAPEQSVVIPIKIFPQIPSYYSDCKHSDGVGLHGIEEVNQIFDKASEEPWYSCLSRAVTTDLADLNELGLLDWTTTSDWKHVVQASLLIHTSRGTVEQDISISAYKNNPYRIPHSILFHSDGFVSTSDFNYVRRESAYGYRLGENVTNDSAFEFDLYMDNSNLTEELRVIEVFPSRDDLFEVKYAHSGGYKGNNLAYFRYNNCGPTSGDVRYCNRPKAHDLKGPIVIPPAGRRSYIATLRMKGTVSASLFDAVGRMFLGYLQIITSRDELSIVLEFKPFVKSESSGGRKNKMVYSLINPKVIPGVNEMYLNLNSTYNSSNSASISFRHACDFMTRKKAGSRSLQKPINSNMIYTDMTRQRKVSVSPSFIDFGVLTSLLDEKKQGVAITNRGIFPLHLIRATVNVDLGPQFNTNEQRANSDDVDDYETAIKATIQLAEDGNSRVIQPGETVDDIAILVISSNSDLPNVKRDMPLIYHGTAIIHTGRLDQTYEDWKEKVINDPVTANEFLVEISFTVRILYGHIEYDVDAVYFPSKQESNFVGKFQKNNPPSFEDFRHWCSESFDRTLYFTNSFTLSLQIQRIYVQGEETGSNPAFLSTEFCSNHFHIVHFEGMRNRADSGEAWGGITVRYRFVTDVEDTPFLNSKRCTLVLQTDLAGKFNIPLWIFSGLLHVNPENAVIPPQCRVSNGNLKGKNGMECLASFGNSKPTGIALSSAFGFLSDVNDHQSDRSQQSSWINYAKKHLLFMGRDYEADDDTNILEPIVLSIGTLLSNTVKTCSIFMINHNPTPISITAIVPSVEGTEVRLGRTVADVMDYMHTIEEEKFNAKLSLLLENHSKDWLKTYLSTTNLNHNFFGALRYRDDVYLSRTAPEDLKQLFHKNAIIRIHQSIIDSGGKKIKTLTQQNTSNSRHTNDINSEQAILSMHPPGFTNSTISDLYSFEGSVNISKSIFSGSVISREGEVAVSNLVRGKVKQNSPPVWIIPPGGVARLEVLVRPPSERLLLGHGLMDFISTGVILKTSYGQRLPVVVTYRGLAGQISIDADVMPEDNIADKETEWLSTPAMITQIDSFNELYLKKVITTKPPSLLGTKVVIRNTLPRGTILKKIYSCNNWFFVRWDPSSSKEAVEPISATLYSTMSCPSYSNRTSNPSFFDCALVWVEQRYEIQQRRCDMNQEELHNVNSVVAKKGLFSESGIEDLRRKLIKQLKDILLYLDKRYEETSFFKDSAGKSKDSLPGIASSHSIGLISTEVFDMFHEMAVSWDAIDMVGLNIVTGNIRADFQVKNDTDSNRNELKSTNVSISLASPYLRSTLKIPHIFNPRRGFPGLILDGENYLQFNVTPVAQVAQLYVPIHNPSGSPIRVRLATMISSKTKSSQINDSTIRSSIDSDFFVQGTPKESNPWWTGGSYYLADQKGTMMCSTHNVTLKAGKGASLSLSNPSLHSSTAFVQGCFGRRCGYSDSIKKEQKKTATGQGHISPIGASATKGEKLRGRYYDHEGGENKLLSSIGRNFENYHPFALGLRSLHEIIIPPFSVGQLGPVYFRPPSRRKFKSLLFLENNLTGLEDLTVEGKGGWEKVVFFDRLTMELNGMNGDDMEMRYDKPTLKFPGSSKGCNGSVVKSVVVANIGDTIVEFENIRLSEANTFHSNRKKSNFVHRSDQDTHRPTISRCNKRGFTLLGCVEGTSFTNRNSTNDEAPSLLHGIMKPLLKLFPDKFLLKKSNEGHMNSILNGFSLSPNETKVLHISHTPDSTFSSIYVALNLDFKRIDHRFQSFEGPDLQSTAQHSTLQDETLQLLLGFDLSSSETARCEQPIRLVSRRFLMHDDSENVHFALFQIGRFKFYIQYVFELFAVLVPLVLLSFILIDMFRGTRQRCAASKYFVNVLSFTGQFRERSSGKKGDSESWSCAYRYLSRIDPNSSDLENISREQTRQMVLVKYRKKGVLHPQCILPNGKLVRVKHFSFGNSESNEVKDGSNKKDGHSYTPVFPRRNAGPITVVFDRCQNFDTSIPVSTGYGNFKVPLIPFGLCWREATMRGIIPPSPECSCVPEQQNLSSHPRQTVSFAKITGKDKLSQRIDGTSDDEKAFLQDDDCSSLSHKEKLDTKKVDDHKMKSIEVENELNYTVLKTKVKNKAYSQIVHTGKDFSPPVKHSPKYANNLKLIKYKRAFGTERNGIIEKKSVKKADLSEAKKNKKIAKCMERKSDIVQTPSWKRSDLEVKSVLNTQESILNGIVPPKSVEIGTTIEAKVTHVKQRELKEKNHARLLTFHREIGKCEDVIEGSEEFAADDIDSLSGKFLNEFTSTTSGEGSRIGSTRKIIESGGVKSSIKPLIESLNEKNENNADVYSFERESISREPDDCNTKATKLPTATCPTLKAVEEEDMSQNLTIRPPPGLSPPPGFTVPICNTNHDVILPVNSKLSSDVGSQKKSITVETTGPNHSLFFETSLSAKSNEVVEDFNKTVKESLLSPEANPFQFKKSDDVKNYLEPVDDEPLLGLGQDFNVINFLNFLDETVPDDDDSDQDKNNSTTLASLDAKKAAPPLNYNTIPSSIPSNPWSESETPHALETPRALAYGIEVEGVLDKDDEAEVPHFIPAMLLGVDGIGSDDETTVKKFDGDSFFSNLLEEE